MEQDLSLTLQKLATIALSLQGKPYERGAQEQTDVCFDCSSFVQYVFEKVGMTIPRSTILQAADAGGKVIVPDTDFSNMQVGDLIFMRSDRGYYYDELFGGTPVYIGHVAMYLGDGMVIHARKKAGGVIVQSLQELIHEPGYGIVMIKRFF